MKRILIILSILTWMTTPFVFAITQTPAANISVTTGTFSNCLSSMTTNAQLAFNTLDTCLGNIISSQWVTSGNNIYSNNTGNVGIGNTNPSTKLDVNGIIRTSSGGIKFPDNTIQTTASVSTPPGGSSGQYQYNNGGNFAGGTMLLTDGSNVGIGTPSPGKLLDVAGIIRSTSGGFTFPDGTTQTSAATSTPPAGSGTEIQYRNGSSFGAVSGSSVTLAGNVGIGSTNPSYKLDVGGTGRFTTAINTPSISNLTTNGFLKTSGSTGVLSVDTTSYQPAITGLTTNYVQKALSSSTIGNSQIFDDGTNVGIGTVNVSAKLQVNGSLIVGVVPASAGTITTNSSGNILFTPGTGGTVSVFTSGNLGVGTTLTRNKLDVSSNVAIGTAYAGYSAAPSNGLIVQGNVGVGSINPGTALDVQGTVRASSDIKVGANSVCQSTGTNCPGSLSGFANPTSSTGLAVVNGSATTSMRSDASPALSQAIIPTWTGVHTFSNATNSAFFTGGNVGIGTLNPGTLLDVSGVIRSTSGGIQFPDGTTQTTASSGSGPAGSGTELQYRNGSSLGAVSNTTVDSGGNIGIGTIDVPTSIFNISKSSSSSSSSVYPSILIQNKNTTTRSFSSLNVNGANGAVQGEFLADGVGNSILATPSLLIGATNDVPVALIQNNQRKIAFDVGGFIGVGTSNPSTFFEVSTGKFNVVGGPNFNVGVSSINPGAKLDVQGDARFSTSINTPAISNLVSNGFVKTSGGNGTLSVDTTSYQASGNYITALTGSDVTATGPGSVAATLSSTWKGFTDGGTAIYTTTSTDNVGIGTTIPIRLLDVAASDTGTTVTATGTASISVNNLNTTAGNYESLSFMTVDSNGSQASAAKVSGVNVSHTNSAISGSLAFLTTNAGTQSQRMVIDNAGNVGIGSAVPGQVLDVSGIIRSTTGAVATPNITIGSNGNGISSPATNNLAFSISAAEKMRLDASGNVGIGTTGPVSRFELVDSHDISAANYSGIKETISLTGSSVSGNGSTGMTFTVNTATSADPGARTTTGIILTNSHSTNSAYSGTIQGVSLTAGSDSNANTTLATKGMLLLSGSTRSGGTVTNAYGLEASIDAVGTTTNGYNLHVTDKLGAGTLTNQYGLYVDSLTGGSTLNYAAYTAGTTPSYFGGNIGIGSTVPTQALDVVGTVKASNLIDSGVTANTLTYANGSKQLASATVSTGLGLSSGTLTSNAAQTISYQPGLLSAVNATIGVYGKVSAASTVDNIIGSAITFSCIANPTITMYECGTSTTCSGPTTIGTVTVTSAGTAFTGTVSNPAVTAGDYIGWAITAGTCASIDVAATAQLHAN